MGYCHYLDRREYKAKTKQTNKKPREKNCFSSLQCYFNMQTLWSASNVAAITNSHLIRDHFKVHILSWHWPVSQNASHSLSPSLVNIMAVLLERKNVFKLILYLNSVKYLWSSYLCQTFCKFLEEMKLNKTHAI